MDDARGKAIQTEINAQIEREYPTWSQYEVDQKIEDIMKRYPGWEYLRSEGIGITPTIMLTQYRPEPTDRERHEDMAYRRSRGEPYRPVRRR